MNEKYRVGRYKWIRELGYNFVMIFIVVLGFNCVIQYAMTDTFTLHTTELCQLKG
jgi:hypothetical protein